MNNVTMKGNLVRDNNFRVSDKGNAFLTNSISVTEGKDKKRTDYFNVVAFGEVAEKIADKFRKGSEIQFEGKLQNNNYEKDGVKVYRDQIVIEKVFTRTEIVDSMLKITDDEELPF
jgi:single-strand DNA-binding protein